MDINEYLKLEQERKNKTAPKGVKKNSSWIGATATQAKNTAISVGESIADAGRAKTIDYANNAQADDMEKDFFRQYIGMDFDQARQNVVDREQERAKQAIIDNALQQQARDKARADKYRLGKVGQFTSDAVGGAIGFGVPYMLSNLVPGGSIAFLGAQGYGSAMERNLLNGEDWNNASNDAMLQAGINIGAEKMIGALPLERGVFNTSKMLNNISNPALRAVARTGAGAIGEGAEEVVQGILSPLAQRINLDNPDDMPTAKDLGSAALQGAIGGAVMGGPMHVFNAVRGNNVTPTTPQQQAQQDISQAMTDIQNKSTQANKTSTIDENNTSDTLTAQAQNNSILEQSINDMMGNRDTVQSHMEFIDRATASKRIKKEYIDLPKDSKLDAYYHEGTIYINKNRLVGTDTLHSVVAHEMYHSLEGTKEHDAIADLALRNSGKTREEAIQDMIDEYAKDGVQLDENAAFAEIGAKYIQKSFTDNAEIERVLTESPSLARRIVQYIKDMIAVYKEKKTLSTQERSAYRDLLKAKRTYEAGLAKLAEGTYKPASVGKRYDIYPNFVDNYDKWIKDGKPDSESIKVGTVSKALQSIGVKENEITIDTSKINTIQGKHIEMTDDIMKQVPNIIENPIIVMESKGNNDPTQDYDNRIVMFGELQVDNKPVLAVLELEPTSRKGNVLNLTKIANAYTKEAQGLINTSKILYIDPNKKRTDNWLSLNRLQLPLDINQYGSINKISYTGKKVKQKKEKETAFSLAYKKALADALGKTDLPDGARASISNNTNNKQAEIQRKIDAKYRKDVEAVRQGKYNSTDTLLLGYTPKVFTDIGFNKLPFVIGSKHVYSIAVDEKTAKNDGRYNKNSNYHHMGWNFVSDIYNRISDPVAIITSETRPQDSIVAIVDNNGKLAAISIDGHGIISGDDIDANALTTSYENTNKASRLLKNALAKEQQGQVAIFYKNNTKLAQFSPAGLSRPGTAANPTNLVVHSITDKDSPVKTKFKDITETRQFKKWFGDWEKGGKGVSKVVDEDGKPMVVYHGSKISPDIFKTKNKWGYGESYFSTNHKVAEMYGNETTSAYINLRNPFIIDANGKRYDAIDRPMSMGNGGLVDTQEVAMWARNHGYDGVIVRNVIENGGIGDDIIAFESNQIKSVDNVGTFNAKRNNIRYSISKTATGKEKTTDDYYQEMIDQYGAIEPGMRPRVDEKVPQSTDGSNKVRKTVRTVMESDNISDDVKSAIKEDLAGDYQSGKLTYHPQSNEQLLNKANKKIERDGVEESLSTLKTKFRDGGLFTSEDMAITEQLLLKYSNDGDVQNAEDLTSMLAVMGTELGRSVQAIAMLKRMTPEGRLRKIQLIVDRLNSEPRVQKTGKEVKITNEMKELMRNQKTQAGMDEAETVIMADIMKEMPVTFWDKMNAWRYLAMLGNARTHIRNMVGNATNAGLTSIKDTMAAAMEDATAKKGTERTKTLKRPTKEAKAFAESVWNADGKQMVDLGAKYEGSRKGEKIFNNRALEGARKLNQEALDWEDTLFKKPAFIKALSQYMTANNITAEQMQNNKKLYAKATKHAADKALRVTFQSENALATAINKASRKTAAWNKYPMLGKGVHAMIEAVFPFKKTPANITTEGILYSPVGLIKALSYDMHRVKKGTLTANQMIDNLAAGLTGTALFALGFIMANAGVLSGGYNADDKRKQNFETSMGDQNYAITIGDSSYTIDWLAPAAMPLLAGAELAKDKSRNHDTEEDDEVLWTRFTKAMVSVTDPALEMSMLQGLSDALQSYQSGAGGGFKYATNIGEGYASQFIPTLLGQFARTIDATKRSTYAPKNSPYTQTGEKFLRQSANKIPFLSMNSEPALDVWGRERKQYGDNAAVRAFNQFLNPASVSYDKRTKVDRELERIYDKTGENTVLPKTAEKYVTYDKKTYQMSAKEYTAYQKRYGQANWNDVKAFMDSNVYKNMNDDERAEYINDIYTYNNYLAKKDFFKKRGVKFSDSTNEKKEKKYSVCKEINVDRYTFDYIMDKKSDIHGDDRKEQIEKMIRSNGVRNEVSYVAMMYMAGYTNKANKNYLQSTPKGRTVLKELGE